MKKEYADLLRHADDIFNSELRRRDLYEQTSQAFSFFLSVESGGGEKRDFQPRPHESSQRDSLNGWPDYRGWSMEQVTWADGCNFLWSTILRADGDELVALIHCLQGQESIHLEVKALKVTKGVMYQCSIGNFLERLDGFSEHGIFHGVINYH